MLRLLFKLFLSTWIACYYLVSPAFASINGVWQDAEEKYWIHLSEQGTVVSLKIKASLSDPEIYLGSLSNSTLQATALLNGATLATTVLSTEDSMAGTLTLANEASSYSATKIFAYEGSVYDGVWSVGENHYLLYISVNSNNKPLTIAIDLIVNDDKTITHDIFAGNFSESTFTGTSLLNQNKSMKLTFSEDTVSLNGQYIVVAIPKEITEFTGSRLFLTDVANVDLKTLKAEFDQTAIRVAIKSALSNPRTNIKSKETKLASSAVNSLTDEQKAEIRAFLAAEDQTTSSQKAKCTDLNYPDFWEWANLCE